MPHNPHFRRDVETSIQTNPASSSACNDLTELPTEKISKSSDFAQKARLLLPFVYGGVASCVAEAATFPIDTAKTRLQLQGQSRDARHASTPYRGMIHCWQKVTADEGLRVLYSGIAPALLRQAVYGTIKYGLYYSLKDLVISTSICSEESAITNVSIAVVSGALSSAIANPTDVLKVRMQSGKISYFKNLSMENEMKSHQNQSTGDNKKHSEKVDVKMTRTRMVAAFKDIYINEGIGGLWRGVSPTAQRASLVAGVQLPVYDLTKDFFIRNDILKESPFNNLASSIVAGLCACLASSPMDVIRTRMMDQRKLKVDMSSKNVKDIPNMPIIASEEASLGSNKSRFNEKVRSHSPAIYRSSFQCGYVTIRKEGVSALYRGFIPAFMRMGPWNIIFFLVYEQLKVLA